MIHLNLFSYSAQACDSCSVSAGAKKSGLSVMHIPCSLCRTQLCSHFDVGKAGVADRFKEALGSVNYYDQRHLCSPTLLIKGPL